MNILNLWQINLIGYLLFMAIFCHYYKLAVKDSTNETSSTILLQIIGGLTILIFVPLGPIKTAGNVQAYILLVVASIFYAINNRLQTNARKNLETSTFAVVSQLSFIFLACLSIAFLKEYITINKVIAILLILSGNCLILLKSGSLVMNKHIATAALSALAGSLGVFISINLSKQFNLPIYISLTFLIPAIILKTIRSVKSRLILAQFTAQNRFNYIIAGSSWGLAILCSLRAMQLGQISVVAPLQATSVLITVISGYIFLNERSLVYRKFVAALLILVAVYINVA